ncbi:MAG: hypothetical protein DIZ77_15720 [endosymbiont of Seepiophila jonesi]|uniref:Cytochrome c domain-containing protein n=1 Tax=endosymbiont of Lamellibrachia luymesi TaxID=2200907 RepID=A0A370DRN2_9GAMM|nr:MAG: hypothetical protein DIZ79_15555 [endosymbiont of Lamellibrachia luymesi]RDH89454.1 MAG: hypothetical protein DIZ77_15720 [endosymbiont of Seepiophila jonesi]
MLMIFCLPQPVAASHPWVGIDLCEVHKDKLPPGLTAESLPDPQSPGAALLHQYCTQCHNLPGPDRHTAAEWREVTAKMFLLMDVSHRFGGLMGRVEIMQREQQARLLAYLESNATVRGRIEGGGVKPPYPRHYSQHVLRSLAPTPGVDQPDPHWLTRLWVLVPFLLLMGLGLFRWWRHSHHA